MKLIWLLVNCNSAKEAKVIGRAALAERQAACFDIFSRLAAFYFWPPRSNKIESARGCLLVLETLPKQIKALKKLVKKLHSDQLPFVGSLTIGDLEPAYLRWLKGELK